MTNRFLLLLFLLMGISLSAPAWAESSAAPGSGVTNVADATVQKEAPKSTDVVSFTKICGEKTKDRGRLRYCSKYFEKYLGVKADPIIYLRQRVTILSGILEKSAKKNFYYHQISIFLLLLVPIAFIAIYIWLAIRQRDFPPVSAWIGAITTLSVLLVGFISAFGWLESYRAAYSGYIELKTLRDRIEVDASHHITFGKDINEKTLDSWTSKFTEISERFARNYVNASKLPDFGKLKPK